MPNDVYEIIQKLRETTYEDYPHVLAAYGSAYANGWRFGRERAAETIELDYKREPSYGEYQKEWTN